MIPLNSNNESVEIYKGYEIRTKTSGSGHCSLIYKNGESIGGTVTDLTRGGKTSIEKARLKIDLL